MEAMLPLTKAMAQNTEQLLSPSSKAN
jgi:hypothetical protein